MNKKYINIAFSVILVVVAGFAVKSLFFHKSLGANHIYILSSDHKTLSTETQAYTLIGTSEQNKNQSSMKEKKEIGETQNGDKVYEGTNDQEQKLIEVILNKDHRQDLIYSLKK